MSEFNQSVVLNNRCELVVSGIKSVDEFNEELIVASTIDDTLITVEGFEMTVKDVNIDKNTFSVSGNIISFSYSERNAYKKGLLKRLFGGK